MGLSTYSVKEIYFTLQGEGIHSGRPAVFCRFTGCNLWSGRESDKKKAICDFCDTDFVGTNGQLGGKYETPEALVETTLKLWPANNTHKFIVLTGGEPMLQVDEKLIKELKKKKFQVAIETNGTIKCHSCIDWICVSPKSGSLLKQKSGNELKVIFPQPKLDYKYLVTLPFDHHLIQPMDGPNLLQNTEASIEFCKKNPDWRFSFQLHKAIGIK